MATSSGRLVDPDGLFPNTGWLRRWRGCVVADYAGLDSRHPRRLLNDAAPQSRGLGDRGIDVLDADEEGHQRTPFLERTDAGRQGSWHATVHIGVARDRARWKGPPEQRTQERARRVRISGPDLGMDDGIGHANLLGFAGPLGTVYPQRLSADAESDMFRLESRRAQTSPRRRPIAHQPVTTPTMGMPCPHHSGDTA